MNPKILFRVDADNELELEAAQRHWTVELDRTQCRDSLVVGRYSVLPFYDALEAELAERGCRLINTFAQHQWIADFEYYDDFRDITPESWTDDEFADAPDGPFVIKGKTNSFKLQWSELMFAADKEEATRKATVLRQRQAIAQQGLLFRRFVPLQSFGQMPNGLPISNEWRFFFVGERLVGHGFYWSQSAQAAEAKLDVEGMEIAHNCASRVADRAAFFVVDIARTADGRWILIELNDAQTSGLTTIDPDTFYQNLLAAVSDGVH